MHYKLNSRLKTRALHRLWMKPATVWLLVLLILATAAYVWSLEYTTIIAGFPQ